MGLARKCVCECVENRQLNGQRYFQREHRELAPNSSRKNRSQNLPLHLWAGSLHSGRPRIPRDLRSVTPPARGELLRDARTRSRG